MNLKWIADSIGEENKCWVLRDVEGGGRPFGSIGHHPHSIRYSLIITGVGLIAVYDTLEEAQAVGIMLAPLPYKEKAAYKTVINRMN